MNAVETAGGIALVMSLTVSALLVVLLVSLDWRERRAERRATPVRPPAIPRSVAVFCGSCGRPVRYQVHPQGRRDAVRLHMAFECEAQLAIRRPR